MKTKKLVPSRNVEHISAIMLQLWIGLSVVRNSSIDLGDVVL